MVYSMVVTPQNKTPNHWHVVRFFRIRQGINLHLPYSASKDDTLLHLEFPIRLHPHILLANIVTESQGWDKANRMTSAPYCCFISCLILDWTVPPRVNSVEYFVVFPLSRKVDTLTSEILNRARPKVDFCVDSRLGTLLCGLCHGVGWRGTIFRWQA